MKKRVVSILLTGMAVLSLAACTSNGLEAASATNDNAKEAEAGTEKKEGISVYWVGKTLNNPWWISVSDFAQQTADNLGVDLTIAIPQEEVDLEKQVSMIEAAIEKKADAIVVSAASSDGVIPAIKKAREAGIKIVNFDTRISDTSVIDAFVGGDDVAGAYKAGKYICEQLGGEGEVAIITGLMEQSTGVDRHAGFMQACAEYPGIKVVAEQGAEWSSVNMTMDGDLDAFVSLPNLDEGAMGVKLATALVMNSDYHYDREILYDCTLVTGEFVDGLTDQTIYEYAAERFPLRGLTEKGY